MDDNSEVKKSKGTKKCVIKRRFKSVGHKVYTEEVNKIALSSNDDQRLQTFDKIETYSYGTNAFKVCESEMLAVKDLFFEKLQ